jgi:hypothetical protein
MTAGGDDRGATLSALQYQTSGRRTGNAPTMPANLMTRYGMTLDAQKCSRITTADGFRPTSACQRTALLIINMSRGQPKAAR